MKIYEAAIRVLEEAQQPMHARDIHREIVAKKLYSFGAMDPVSIVSQALRKRSEGAPGAGNVIFKRMGPGTYGLIGWTISGGR